MIHTLPNGVRVVTLPCAHTQMAHVGVFVKAGSADEPAEWNGISHFLEHMAFKGTKRRSCNKISSDAERLGARINAFTDRDLTAYYVEGLPEHVPQFLDILSDIFLHSKFDPAEIEREREVILQEYRGYADSGSNLAHDFAYRTAYPNQPMGRRIIGEPKTIKAIQREHLQRYVAQHYHGSKVIVGIAGKFDEDAAVKLAETLFAPVPATGNHLPSLPAPVFASGTKVIRKALTQSSVHLMTQAVSDSDPMRPAYEVAGVLLGGGMSSPLFLEVREKRSLAYSIGAYAETRDWSGTWSIVAGTTSDQLDAYLNTVRYVIERTANRIKPIDMERARNAICVELAAQAERTFHSLLETVTSLFGPGPVYNTEEEIEKIRSVKPSQVQRVLRQILQAPRVIVAVGKDINQATLEKF